jgi:hypothetical protein
MAAAAIGARRRTDRYFRGKSPIAVAHTGRGEARACASPHPKRTNGYGGMLRVRPTKFYTGNDPRRLPPTAGAVGALLKACRLLPRSSPQAALIGRLARQCLQAMKHRSNC